MLDLGTIKKVDLREVWPNEATDFTPWLVENLSILGDALRMELEFQKREAPVGGFSLDLLARDLGRDRLVVIENQLTATDHDHLGKLLTYAAGYDAGVVIWLAQEIGEEHRQTLDWLNQRTDTNTEFYGVVVELLQIGDSKPAPNFKLVAFPNEWRKTNISASGAVGVSEQGQAYQRYFQDLIDRLREDHKFTGARKAPSRNSYWFASGFPDIGYTHTFPWGGQVRVNVYIDRDEVGAKSLFDALVNQKESLEAEIGEALEWEGLGNRRAAHVIFASRPGSIENDPQSLEEIKDWAIDRLLKFKEVFGPRLAEWFDGEAP